MGMGAGAGAGAGADTPGSVRSRAPRGARGVALRLGSNTSKRKRLLTSAVAA